MDLRNCIICGKLFMYVSKRVCPACAKEMDELFEKVRLYVKKNPGATVTEIAEALEIEEAILNEFVREGRFDRVEGAVTFFCESCGKATHRGRFCDECAASLDKEMRGALPKQPEEPVLRRDKDEQRLYLADHIMSKDGGKK